MVLVATEVRADIDRQRHLDHQRGGGQPALLARMRAVVEAQHRLALRVLTPRTHCGQSLVDLAAAAELVADELPEPTLR